MTAGNAARPADTSVGGGSSAASSAGSTPSIGSTPATDSGKDACQYLTVDQVKAALKYSGKLQAGSGNASFPNDSMCQFTVPGDEEAPATVDIMTDPRMYDAAKATFLTTGCKSAGIGDESVYCPGGPIIPVMFTKGGVVVLVSVRDSEFEDWKTGNPVDAGLALGKIVAGEL